jgi:hypothetical protein
MRLTISLSVFLLSYFSYSLPPEMNRDHNSLLTRNERRLQQTNRRRIVIASLCFALLIGLALVLATPASHAINGWQARRHAANAFRLIEKESWSEARKEAVAALQLSRNQPAAIRAVARFLSRTGQPEAIEFWKQLAAKQKLTRVDLRDEAASAFALENSEVAEAALKYLLSPIEGGPRAEDWLLAAQIAVQANAMDKASSDLAKVFPDPAVTDRQLFRASLLQLTIGGNGVTTGAKAAQAAGWARLTKLAQGENRVALDALTLLAQREMKQNAEGHKPKTAKSESSKIVADAAAVVPLSTNSKKPITASEIADALDSHPLAKAPQHLLAVDLRITALPSDKEQLTEQAIKRWKISDNEALAALAKWLNGNAEYEKELATVPLERALQTRDLFLQHLDACGGMGRWEEIRRLLESERFPLDPTIAHMYLARCYAQLGQTVASENNWQRALEMTGGDAPKLMTLADYAQKNGAASIANAACDAVIANDPKLRSAWQRKLQIAQAERETGKIHAILEKMLQLWPDDQAIQNDEAYARLLSLMGNHLEGKPKQETRQSAGASSPGEPTFASKSASVSQVSSSEELASLEMLAKRLIGREPTSLPHRTLLALIYLNEDRPATALAVYRNLHVPPSALTPSALAVHAAVLGVNGNALDAAQEAAQIPRNALLPEEAVLIEGL